MRRKIVILGSTGSIGKSTLDVIRKDKKNFEIMLLSANEDYKKLLKQVSEFSVKNILVYNDKIYDFLKKNLRTRR